METITNVFWHVKLQMIKNCVPILLISYDHVRALLKFIKLISQGKVPFINISTKIINRSLDTPS